MMDARGFVHIVDRKKDMILVSGFNVYPSEVEEVCRCTRRGGGRRGRRGRRQHRGAVKIVVVKRTTV